MFYIFIITIVTGIDQWTKYLVETQLKPIGAIPIVKDIFHLTYARNTGAAFSILRDKQALLILVTAIVVGALIYYLSLLQNQFLNGLFTARNTVQSRSCKSLRDCRGGSSWPITSKTATGISSFFFPPT